MSVNTELQALLTKMGGSPSEEDSNSDLIKKISNAYEGGGGSGSGILISHITATGDVADGNDNPVFQLDKTWKEIYNAPYTMFVVMAGETKDYSFLVNIFYDDGYGLTVWTMGAEEPMQFLTDSEDGYPRTDGGK